MTAALALFDLDEQEIERRDVLAESNRVYEWLCQRGWTVVPDGPFNTPTVVPAWVCASCGSVHPNAFLLQLNRHTAPRDISLAPDAQQWVLRPRTPFGCDAVMHASWARFERALRDRRPIAFDAGWLSRSTLLWAPTREAAEALSAA